MLVSILIPCYNSFQFIAETLDSLLVQTHTNWECIIVDDHSTDNSVEIINNYCEKYPGKIKLFTNPKKGACSARNTAFEKCKGEYVKFLDADDALFDENVIDFQLKYAKLFDYDIVYGNEYHYTENFEDENLVKIYKPEIYNDTIATSFFRLRPITSNPLLKKSKIDFIRWNENLSAGQEKYFFIQCYLEGLTFSFLNINSAKIRKHNSPYRISNLDINSSASRSLKSVEELEKLLLLYKDTADKAFLLNWEFDKLATSYITFGISKNLKCFLKINSNVQIKKEDIIKLPKKIKFLWQLNRLHPLVGLFWYFFNIKIIRHNIFKYI